MNTSQENYIKTIYSIAEKSDMEYVNTNAIAEKLDMKASSVTEMLKKFESAGIANYKKYKGVKLTKKGTSMALNLIRKHRLWEVFLLEKLDFKWDEVHDIAEQLEHIQSKELTDRLDAFLEHPKFDPHGDPIPDRDGNIEDNRPSALLSEFAERESGIMIGVVDSSSVFLKYLERIHITLDQELTVIEKLEFDGSLVLSVGGNETSISAQAAKNIILKPKRHA
ncbi:MAG: metal-dependent transcriptional regulator [Flavobacteriales bacterium]